MPVIFAILAFGLAALSGAPPQPPCPAVRVRNPAGNYIVPGVRGDIPYSGELALDAYAQRGERRRPTVVVIHGGGWSSGSRSAHVGQILELLTRSGYHWVSLDYRLEGVARYEASLADLRAALGFLRCRAAELGIDPDRLVLLGEDSGAHLAALLAAERPRGVIGAVLIGGFYDLGALPDIAAQLSGDALAQASPVGRTAQPMPPLLVVHGEADTDVPIAQARRFCEGVTRANGTCRVVGVAGASHRSENWWPNQWGYKEDVATWISSLSPGGVPPHQPRDGAVRKDIVYEPSAGLKLDAFVPRAGAGPYPAVIVAHGGGWEAGDKVTYVTPVFEPLARAGLAWFSIDYRLTPAFRHADQLADLRAAVRFVRREHSRFNIDPARIFLLGESASGQMVAQIAAEDDSLAGVVSFYGVYDFPAMVTDASPRSLLVRLFRRTVLDEAARQELRRHSPLYTAHAGMPPVLLVNGTGERLWAQAQAFATRLDELRVPHEVVALDGAPHGMENWEGHPEWMFYKARLVDWIRRRSTLPRRP